MLDFEKPLFEIRNKIESLKESQDKNDVDLQEEIDMLEASLERETKNIYKSKTMGSCANCAFARKTYDTRLYSIYL